MPEPEVAELENILAQPKRAVGLAYLGMDDVSKRVVVVQCVLPPEAGRKSWSGSQNDDAPTYVLERKEPERRRVAAMVAERGCAPSLKYARGAGPVLGRPGTGWKQQALITTDPNMWKARHLRRNAHTAVFAPLARLATFVACSTFLFDTFQTVAELRHLSDRGASTEAEASLTVSVPGRGHCVHWLRGVLGQHCLPPMWHRNIQLWQL